MRRFSLPAYHRRTYLQRSSAAVHDLLRDHDLLDALELVRARAVLEAVLTRAGITAEWKGLFLAPVGGPHD
jgi:hypothetical protein